jgi:AcrR family transcriptional regulator
MAGAEVPAHRQNDRVTEVLSRVPYPVGRRDVWFSAAYRLLADRGVESLTVPALCNRVGVTKGSFYHHFSDLPQFVDALAGRWNEWHVRLFQAVDAEPDLRRRFEIAANAGFEMFRPGGPVVRLWAVSNPTVAAHMWAPHRFALEMSAKAFAATTGDRDSGEVLAAIVGAVTVGLQHRPRRTGRERWLRIVGQEYAMVGVDGELVQLRGRPHLTVRLGRMAPRVTTEPGSVTALVSEPCSAVAVESSVDIRAQYFAAARALLADGGAEAITSRALAERIRLTKGSFRHRFGSMSEFERALADDWEQAHTKRIALAERERNPYRRLELLLADLLVISDPAEPAWRAWGHANAVVGDAVRRADDHLERALTRTLAEVTDAAEAGLLAEMTVAFGLGLHRWYPPFDAETTARAAMEFSRRVLGLDCDLTSAGGYPALAFGRG